MACEDFSFLPDFHFTLNVSIHCECHQTCSINRKLDIFRALVESFGKKENVLLLLTREENVC